MPPTALPLSTHRLTHAQICLRGSRPYFEKLFYYIDSYQSPHVRSKMLAGSTETCGSFSPAIPLVVEMPPVFMQFNYTVGVGHFATWSPRLNEAFGAL